MHLKLLRAAARTAAFGGIVTLGLGSTQAALAQGSTVLHVPCSTTTLINDMTKPASYTTLVLAPNCTYTLTAQLPTVMHTMTIVGNPTTWIKRSTVVDTPSFSVFVVGCSTGNLTLDNVNVRNGGGTETTYGGAVDIVTSGAAATINGGTFTDNNVNSSTGYGGAIANYEGTLVVKAATFTGNSAAYGGAIYSEGGPKSATIRGGTFVNNYASEDGGAIANDDVMTVTGASFSQNYADYNGGAIANDDSLTLDGTSFSQNQAEYGGAVASDGSTMSFNRNLISYNYATYGGGFYNDSATYTATINTSQITFNQASSEGGGIYLNTGTVILTGNDVISQNSPDNCYQIGSITGCSG